MCYYGLRDKICTAAFAETHKRLCDERSIKNEEKALYFACFADAAKEFGLFDEIKKLDENEQLQLVKCYVDFVISEKYGEIET